MPEFDGEFGMGEIENPLPEIDLLEGELEDEDGEDAP
jgi:hypothetical protein